MKIAILSRGPQLYSTRRLVEAAQIRDHQARIVNPLRCYMNITSSRPEIHYRGEVLEPFDAVIPRIGASVTFYGTAVLRQFEMMGVYPANESVAINRSRDKLRSMQLLARAGVGLPVTGFASSPDDTDDLIKIVGGAPLVVKLLEGPRAKAWCWPKPRAQHESVIEAFRGLKANFMTQEFVKEAGGADIRCLVIGGKVVAAMLRQAKEGEFRSNLHRGGTARLVKLSAKERATAVKSGQGDGAERGRGRHPARQGRPGGDGGQLLAGFGRDRKSHRKRRCRDDHRKHRGACQTRPHPHPRQGAER